MTSRVASGAVATAQSLEASAASVGVRLRSDQAEAIVRFNALLQRWSTVYNLTAVRDPAGILALHTIDCLAAVPALRRELARMPGNRVLDVGSGGGLPGVIFAIANPEVQVTCLDAVGKKVAFVTQANAQLGLRNLAAVHARVEAFRGNFDVVASRAFSSLSDLVRLSSHLRSAAGVWMAMKGKEPHAELAELPKGVVFHVEHLRSPALAGDRCLVWMSPSAPPLVQESL